MFVGEVTPVFPVGFLVQAALVPGAAYQAHFVFFRLVGPWSRQEVGKIVKNVSMPGILKVDTLNNWSIWQRDFSKLDITSFYSNVHNHPRLGGQQILQAAPNTPSEGWQHGSRESWAIHLHCGYVLPTHAVMGWSIGAWLCIPWKKPLHQTLSPYHHVCWWSLMKPSDLPCTHHLQVP